MIIYGWKSKQLAKEIIIDKCSNCGAQNSIEFYIFQKYAHVFWIPFFPIGKTAVSQCDSCKQILKLNEMPPSLKAEYANLKSRSKTPIWTFSGLAIIAVIITASIINSQKRDEKNSKLILAPQSGDIFEIKTADNQYTLYKAQSVLSNTVFIRANQYETNNESGLTDIKNKGDNAYSDDVIPLSNAVLKTMLEKGEILDIDRK